MDQIELYRDTKESIMRGREPEVWEGMPQVPFSPYSMPTANLGDQSI